MSVQQRLEEALTTLLRQPVEIVGAGRTDAGVNARMMTAHFEAEGVDGELVYRLNRLLPRDIAVSKIEEVPAELHARFSATARTYRYYVHTKKDPFKSHSLQVNYPLDFDLMNKAAEELLKTEDFAAFSKTHTDVKTTICKVSEARWVRTGEGEYQLVSPANRFLRNMVRAVVGTLLEVGRGKLSLEEFKSVIKSKNRCAAGDSVIGEALFLEDIKYGG